MRFVTREEKEKMLHESVKKSGLLTKNVFYAVRVTAAPRS